MRRYTNAMKTTLLTMALVTTLATSAPVRAQTLRVLYNFGASPGDPLYPVNVGWIAEGKDGSMWTTGQQGGKANRGAIIKFAPDGKMTLVYSFDLAKGASPQSGLTLGRDGSFYGTCYGGGKFSIGTIFKIAPDGTFTHLHDFNGPDGSYPISPPVQGKDGNLYGVASYTGNYQAGCIYKITPSGSFTPLYHFTGPQAATFGTFAISLTPGSDGNFYGTTIKGGTGFGTIYKVTPTGTVTVLHVFDNVNGADKEAATASLYLNGELQGSLRNPMQFHWDLKQSAIMLGIDYIGDMDELAIFRRALTANEVRSLYQLPHGLTVIP